MRSAYAILLAGFVIASPALADPIIGSGDVMGNGTASPRTPTDTPLINVMNQTGSGLGTGVAGGAGHAVNGALGFPLVNGAQTNDDCLKWAASGITDSGGSCATTAIAPQGRLTFATGVPVMTSDVTAGSTVYFTPFGGNTVPVWNGAIFTAKTFTELSQALSDATKSPAAAVAANVYDVFVWNDGGTLRATRGPTWASGGGSNTVRGTGAGSTDLTRVNGFLVNTNAITNGPGAGAGTYVGTIATDAGGATVTWSLGGSAAGGKAAFLDVWNAFNRVRFNPNVIDATASHTYTTATFRAWNASNAMRITYVIGRQDENQTASLVCLVSNGAGLHASISIGFDSTLAAAAAANIAITDNTSGNTTLVSNYAATVLGLHALQAVEEGGGGVAATFFGAPFQTFIGQMSM